ncbi:MAG: 4-(cytidine 5'-diphospho)-2-C-methyl-D-erythritol kinase [Ruminococcus sp.]|nr:4-(cytidine 5'-diphospho)-2-C-methyl-D-erythritol kinase [Ruminococcus sp.]
MNEITVRAYGKLNLYLDITGIRADGYHDIKSVMQSVSVYDTLNFKLCPGSGIELICDVPGFPTDSSNLICKAANKFFEHSGIIPQHRLRVTVDKKIPSMAGMAGGSADCAAALRALNELYGRPFDRQELLDLAAKLGADVPFTLIGGTMLCEGIGEKLTPLPFPEEMYFAAVQPESRISTAAAYKAYDSLAEPPHGEYGSFEAALKAGDIRSAAGDMFNIFEYCSSEPSIEEAKRRMLELGALGAMMTGSGSVVFGVFDNRDAAQSCIENMSGYPFAEVLEPCREGTVITGVDQIGKT